MASERETFEQIGLPETLDKIRDMAPDLMSTDEVPEGYKRYKVANAIGWKFEIGKEPGDPKDIAEAVVTFITGFRKKMEDDREQFGDVRLAERLFVFGDPTLHRSMHCGFYGWIELAAPEEK